MRSDAGVELAQHLLRERLELPTPVGQPDPERAPVGGVALPPHEPGTLGRADERRHRLLAEACSDGERAHAQAVLLEEGEEDKCSDCGASLGDGEGYDGRCGACADKAEADKEEQRRSRS